MNIHQARLSIAQAERTMEMSALQRYDTYLSYQQGESMRRISILATIFLPISVATVSDCPVPVGCLLPILRLVSRDS